MHHHPTCKNISQMANQNYPFIFTALFLLSLFGCKTSSPTQKQAAAQGDFYELRTYHIKSKAQEQSVDNYLQQAFLPALHRAGWRNIGVFKPIDSDTANAGKRVFVLIPARSLEALAQLPQTLQNDSQHGNAAQGYWNATNDLPPYQRMEISWLSAFSRQPRLEVPIIQTPRTERVYEIRSYESATEKLYINKVHMFNVADEVALFKKLGFNAVFYGSVLSGPRMPNLIYMVGFDNEAARSAHWKTFVEHPEWKTMTALPEYKAKNVSKIDSYLLHPTSYSDF